MQSLEDPIINQKTSTNEGQEVTILVGVHGNEKGPQLKWDWLNSLEIKRGTLNLIFANPTASKLNKRFVNVNLNRRFGQNLNEYPEDKIARKIEKVLLRSHASLDLHMYNESMDRPFVICSTLSNQIAEIIPAKYVVNIPQDADGGGTDDFMAMQNKLGVCFETGSVDRPDSYSETIKQGVLSFLSLFKLIDHDLKRQENQIYLSKNSTKMVESDDIRFSKDYSSFDKISAGEIICVENGIDHSAEKDGYILFPRPSNPVGTEAYYTMVAN